MEECTCLKAGETFIRDPWCPEHKVVLDLSGYVGRDQGDECQRS